MPNNIQKGNQGEEIARAHLLKMGYSILEKNWRHKHLEIDIIASINSTLVIVEVKLRANAFFGNPEEFVTSSKQKKLIKAADFYEAEVDEMVAGLSSLLEPIIIVFLGTLIGGIVVAMYLPIFKLGQVV